MSKSHSDENFNLNNLDVDQNSTQLKRLRFHPYYYQGRKGSLYQFGKRTSIKIAKIEKNETELVLTISGKERNKTNLKCYWDQITFDYYSIINTNNWKILFPRK